MNKVTETLKGLPGFGGKKVLMERGALIALRILCIVLALAFAAGAYAFTITKESETETTVYEVETQSTAKYEVRLNPNSFFEKDRMDMGENYIRSIVRSVDMVFNYDLSASGEGRTDVAYTVTGTMSTWFMDGNQEKELWSKTTVITESEGIVSNGDCTFSVPVNVNQAIYAAQLQKFQEEMDFSANGYYDVTLSVTAINDANGEIKVDTSKATVTIPLNGKVFSPRISQAEEPVKTQFVRKNVETSEPNWKLFGVLIGLAVLSLLGFAVLMLCFDFVKKDAYLTELRSMIASIEDRIAYVQSVNELTGENIALTDFDSIIHLADERVLPILCARDDVARRSVFFVTENNQKFYYIFDDSKVKNEEDDEEE